MPDMHADHNVAETRAAQPGAADLKPGAELAQLRAVAPLVHNITNYVAMGTVANVLLAAGAAPAMVHAREEAAGFVASAAALAINIGTLSADWLASMEAAARAAVHAGRPWVLDPVAVGATPFRQQAARGLLTFEPRVIRGNASEIMALAALVVKPAAGEAPASGPGTGRGVDATDSVEAAEPAALALAKHTGAVVAVSGSVDLVTDGQRRVRIDNGHPLMPKVTALGCGLTGVIAAFLGAGSAAFEGTAAAFALYGVAGERAAGSAAGPGSFAVGFLDALAAIDPSGLNLAARIRDG